MSYTDYDFPHTHFYESDLRELISMYRKITAEVADIKKWKDEQYRDYEEILAKTRQLEIDVNNCIEAIAKQNEVIDEKFEDYEASIELKIQTEIRHIENMFNTLCKII